MTRPSQPRPDWLRPIDPEDFFRPWDYFVVQVAHARLSDNPEEHSRLQLDAAGRFAEVHGQGALVEALLSADRMSEGLDGVLATVLSSLTRERAA